MKTLILVLLLFTNSCQSSEIVPVMEIKAGQTKYYVFEIEGHRYIAARSDGSPFLHAMSCKCFNDTTRVRK